jgi:probable dihydroxyacetone kinase regulator
MIKISTKQILAESLLQLAEKKNIEKISVRAIVKNCGAGRQTFYNHFRDKYDLISWIYISYVDQIIDQYMVTEPWGIVIGRSYTFMRDHAKFFEKAVSEEGHSSFFHSFYEYIENFYINFVRTTQREDALTDDLLFDIRFNSYASVSMGREWLINGMKEPPEVLGIRIANAMPQSLKKYIEEIRRNP